MEDDSHCTIYPKWTPEEARAYAASLDGSFISDDSDGYLFYLDKGEETYQLTLMWNSEDGTFIMTIIED